MNFSFSIYLILPAALGPGVYSAAEKIRSIEKSNNLIEIQTRCLSGLWHSASTNYASAFPHKNISETKRKY
jgi:hypothetical protein